MIRVFPLLLVLGAAVFAACGNDPPLTITCGSDDQCVRDAGRPSWVCSSEARRCVCVADDACGPNELCEPLPAGDGRCVPKVACEWNEDCGPGEFCDNQVCRRAGCSADVQCRIGEVCDTLVGECKPGCRSHGDCVNGEACVGETGDYLECDEAVNREGECPEIGECTRGVCPDKSFCRLGDLCLPPEEGEGLNSCSTDDRGPYCAPCQGEVGTPCDSLGPNFCLVDQMDPSGRGRFCGVDCSQGQECPNGFECSDVLVLTDDLCTGNAQCRPRDNAQTCTSDAECAPGNRCAIAAGAATGRCAGICQGSEGGQVGYCTCVTDDDCPQQTCDDTGRCDITRDLCVGGVGDTCRTVSRIRCVSDGGSRYCRIGANCAPEDGISCTDVRCDQNPDGCQQQ